MWMVAVLGIIWIFMVGGTRKAALVPGRWQAAVESVYGFIDNTLSANVGPEGRRFVPLIFSLFMFIIVANFAGLLPVGRSEEHTSELQSLIRISYAVFCLKKKNKQNYTKSSN